MSDTLRLDKWLWHARFAKTRTDAIRLVETQQVRINGQKTDKAHHLVRRGDVLTFAARNRIVVVRIIELAERRLGAEAARGLYQDITQP